MNGRSRPRVVYWFNQPTPYVVARFNAVADRGELEFEGWFSEIRQSDRSWDVDESEWRFPARYIPLRHLPGLQSRIPIPELEADPPDVFVCEYDRFNLAAGAAAARVKAARLAFRVLPNYDAWSERTWWREAAKHLLFKSIDGAKVPGPDGAALATRYGLPRDRVSVVTQSIDVTHYSLADKVAADVRKRRRQELGLQGCVFLFVGRLWSGKGLDEMLGAYRQLAVSEVRTDVSLLIVGDGADGNRYRAMASDLPRVSFPGFVQPSDLPDWYALADCLVLPTHGDPNGLVVEEAFAAGIPVICSDAAGDIRQRLPQGEAGFVFPVGDSAALADFMRSLADDARLRVSMGAKGRLLAATHTDQRFAEDFCRFVSDVMNRPAQRGAAVTFTRAVGYGLLAASRMNGWQATPLVQRGR